MKSLNVSEARRGLPSLIDEVFSKKGRIVITRRGRPVAQLISCSQRKDKSDHHPLRGTPIVFSDDFDTPMPELWQALHS